MTETITAEMIAERVQQLAMLRQMIEPSLPDLKMAKNKAERQLKEATVMLEEAEAELREMAMAYVSQTGDLEPHPALTFRRTKKLIYSQEEVTHDLLYDFIGNDLEFWEMETDDWQKLLESGQMGKYLKVKVSLDVRTFETDYKADDKLHYLQVEEVSAPTIAISRLGDVVIAKEIEGK